MPTSATTSTSASRAKAPPKTTPAAPATSRVTRLRAAKEGVTPSPSLNTKPARPAGLLARGKEGLRMVSDKIKEKETQRTVSASKPPEVSSYSHSLQAFLRIRPAPSDAEVDVSRTRPYLEPQGDRDVLMQAPLDPARPNALKPPHVYSFDRVFAPTTSQSSFFTTTTLPLVDNLLHGENGLLFAYGVSNSGKSYTISGASGTGEDDRGVLPRSIDVVFNSIKGLESQAHLRCTGLADVELTNGEDEHFGMLDGLVNDSEPSIDESVKVDRNYSYAVFVSYAEVYNEKIFDLLDAVLPVSSSQPNQPRTLAAGLPRASSAYPYAAFGSSMNLAALANGGGGVLKRRALALKNDPEGSGKYVAGLNEVRVRTRAEALAVFRAGQRARQVFGTLANRESSRSHGIFTIKMVRIHNGAPEDPDSAQVSRLAIVDLAGSERTKNTQTTGDRLKEAGNINKSLMVLGQCLEVLRSNQQKMAAPVVVGMKKKLAVVPFRHSKLTEIFQNFFVGDGRAVMLVNVNPYDTGFDENAHVMRFSAVAREIQTTAQNKVGFSGQGLRRQISTQFSALKQAVSGPMKIKVVVPVLPKTAEGEPAQQRGGSERETQGFVMVEEELEVVEEEDEDGSEDEQDLLVEHLFDQLKELKTRLFESEMRNATIEAEVREEVSREMAETMQKMHKDFSQRFQEQVTAGELKTDRKIDILSRMGATPAPQRTAHGFSETPVSTVDSEDRAMSEATPGTDADLTVDESFESAIDASLSLDRGHDSMTARRMTAGRMSDPFITRPVSAATKPTPASFLQTREAREDTADSDDIIASAPIETDDLDSGTASEGGVEVAEVDEVDEDTNEEDDGDDDDDASGDETDEDPEDDDHDGEDSNIEDGEEGDESPTSDSESEFDNSEASSVSDEYDFSPDKRRKTASPARARVTPGQATPVKTQPKVVKERVKSPLVEKVVQDKVDQVDEDEDEDEEVVFKPKKKRTLGKKIVTEDEMVRADGKVPERK